MFLIHQRQRRVTAVISLCVWAITEGGLIEAWGVGT